MKEKLFEMMGKVNPTFKLNQNTLKIAEIEGKYAVDNAKKKWGLTVEDEVTLSEFMNKWLESVNKRIAEIEAEEHGQQETTF
jgi:putative heme degradation protein